MSTPPASVRSSKRYIHTPSTADLVVYLFGPAVMALMGLILAGIMGNDMRIMSDSRSWVPATAEFISGKVYWRDRPPRWCLTMKYRYSVGNVVYSGKGVGATFFGTGGGCHQDKQMVEQQLARFSQRGVIPIHYNPARPQQVFVYPATVVTKDIVVLLMGLAIFAGGVWAMWAVYRQVKAGDV